MDAVIELEIRAGTADGSFDVRVVRSLAGGDPSATITLDIDEILGDLPRIESSVLASSVRARRVMTNSESAIQEIGVRLFEAVFSGRIGAAYRSSAAVASERNLVPRVALRLVSPGLAALPWEAMYDSEAGRYVSRKEPLVRRVSSPFSAEAPPVQPPLRILGLVSSPRGLQVLDVEAERERLELALHDHIEKGSVELVWLEDVTWSGVQNILLTQPWHVLHFIGHGGFDEQTDEGLVALVGRDGRAEFVTASSLADLLNEADPQPRLVVLNSCQSGATGTSDLFAGTAASLVRSGIHAVVAMQFAISDEAALAFSRSFYVALASGRRIDEAVRSGRIGILGIARDTLEWITPVLYLRGDGARVLDKAPPRVPGADTGHAPPAPIPPEGPVVGVATRGPASDPLNFGPSSTGTDAEPDAETSLFVSPEEPPPGRPVGLASAGLATAALAGSAEAAAAAPAESGQEPRPAPEAAPETPAVPPPEPTPEPAAEPAPEPELAAPAAGSEPAPGAPAEPAHEAHADARPEATAVPVPAPRADASPPAEAPASDAPPPPRPPPPVPAAPIPPSTPPGSRRRVAIIVAIVAVLVLALAGGVWAAFALLNPPQVVAEETDAPSPPTPQPTATVLPAVSLAVPGTVAWTDTGVSCAAGDELAITAEGTINHAPPADATASPDGLADPSYHQYNIAELPDAPHAGLIGRLGQQSPFFIGSRATYVCPENGTLALGINDAGTANNGGAFQATVIRTQVLD
ncbi:CHAT domain-containing protein [Microbacterium sp. DT81.1]|uniref:CHAT domain-containing protein n=1 Tax=Microbacterium sp. DT81.1 TaxID=3393413 RepID=UPI003CECF87D